jgi:arginase
VPLVLGGDCTIELGVSAGTLRSGREGELGPSFRRRACGPRRARHESLGILDSTGVAHMIAEEGTAEELSRVGPRFPLLPEEMIVLFGHNTREPNDAEAGALARR